MLNVRYCRSLVLAGEPADAIDTARYLSARHHGVALATGDARVAVRFT
jgi:hypothetical protein